MSWVVHVQGKSYWSIRSNNQVYQVWIRAQLVESEIIEFWFGAMCWLVATRNLGRLRQRKHSMGIANNVAVLGYIVLFACATANWCHIAIVNSCLVNGKLLRTRSPSHFFSFSFSIRTPFWMWFGFHFNFTIGYMVDTAIYLFLYIAWTKLPATNRSEYVSFSCFSLFRWLGNEIWMGSERARNE